jgi:hypothetical protein
MSQDFQTFLYLPSHFLVTSTLILALNTNTLNSTRYKITYWNFLSDIGSSAPEPQVDGGEGEGVGAGFRFGGSLGGDEVVDVGAEVNPDAIF